MRAVVTGATNGIGEAIARRLAGEGLTVTLVGRSDERLRAARERIDAAVPGADLVLERADLAELAQVRELAGRLLAGPPPDVVISNAALVTPLDRRTSDGLPRVLTVNHLAPYLLLVLILGCFDFIVYFTVSQALQSRVDNYLQAAVLQASNDITVTGDTVNTTARLQATAAPGTVLVDAERTASPSRSSSGTGPAGST